MTPLYFALAKERKDAIDLLLKFEIDPSKECYKSIYGLFPRLISNKNHEIVVRLIDYGFNFDDDSKILTECIIRSFNLDNVDLSLSLLFLLKSFDQVVFGIYNLLDLALMKKVDSRVIEYLERFIKKTENSTKN